MSEYVSERRAINTLCAYWDQLRNGRSYPAKHEIDPEDIITIWPHCFILSVKYSDGDKKYECIYVGSEATKLYSSDLRYYSEAENVVVFFPQVVENLFDYLESVVENRRPVIEETEKTTAKGNDIKIRQCLLPLGENDTIDHIIGVVGGRIY
ncbi:PAS domain-containing protein [Candidatus Anaplasma sp. TIGMIC]|uniref:PAS domain-containing protein n=1 Tax=Candidatus Anaplasma sp. TIGMIC TaxID=3020713 RepID=UPI002330C901|nr:PAS domain-containing protein [Candidatus Anaplasma sp. TIGMIC]MDB1135798.1 PAS domain-containing protein [Candidatus Anaplasma sp. TIGMIC]